MNFRSISLVTLGHFASDINQGALPALLPFFIEQYHLSYAAAAFIVFAANIASSVIQPIFGYFSDRLSKVWLMPLGIILAGFGMALSGVVGSYSLILLAVAVSGCGVAAFHPDAARLVNRLAPDNKALGMSLFSVGGNAGFAFGPILATSAVMTWGLDGTLIFTIPALIVAPFLYFQFRGFSVPGPKMTEDKEQPALLEDQWFPFIRLTGVVVARSVLFFGLNTFIPLYWINVLHESNVAGGAALTIMFSLGIVSTLIGGRIANWVGYRRMIIAGFSLMLPLLAVFTFVHDTFWATVLLIPISFGLFSTYGPIIATGQNYLPTRVGFASGVTIGLAVTIGGIAAPILGWIADVYSIQVAMQSLIVIPVIAIALTISLPAEKKSPAGNT